MSDTHEQCATYFRTLQDDISAALCEWDGTPFQEDSWHYPGGGGGRSRVLVEGKLFEKAGINFSSIVGEMSEEFASQVPGEGRAFRACGVSVVLHPWNPHLPTVHANFRHLEKGEKAWFGGGADLTPCYPRREDCIHFHRTWRAVCQRHDRVADHPRFKQWCDEYFFLKHRQEARGIGGIFFDWLDGDFATTFAFVRDAGDHFLASYAPIVQRRREEPHTPAQRDFQLYRRGRYVEFNLLYDRGTVFGLKTGGRVESILMSLPLNAKWLYNYQPTPGSAEAALAEYLKPRDWANMA